VIGCYAASLWIVFVQVVTLLTGIGSPEGYFCLEVYENKSVLSVHAQMAF
jgi:hypothetical protein